MEQFWVVTLFHYQPSKDQWSVLENQVINEFQAIGIEEFSLDEPQVDEILGDRSYSGGDLPLEVLDEVESKVLSAAGHYRFFFSDVNNANDFLAYVCKVCLCESQLDEIQTEDWNAEWKKHYSPIVVSENLEIIPSWQKDYKSQTKEQIYIYPGMGFGTGSHETTYLCLKLFTEEILSFPLSRCLDFGSGSGILGLSVFKFFKEAQVDFYDIDAEANKNCYQNALINELENTSFRLLLPEVRDKLNEEYDLVFANILESILTVEKQSLINHTRENGHLILSGLLKPQIQGIIDLYSGSNLKLVKKLEKGDWGAILFKKIKS
jgi:ribosomal protein L11 methyltransferase